MLGALLAAAPEVARGIAGIIQKIKANNIDTTRPTMTIPQSIEDYVNMAKITSTTGLPNKDAISSDIENSTANALQLGKEYGGDIDIGSIYANEQKQKRNLGIQDANARLANIQALQTALRTKAPYEEKVWDYNFNQPYQANVAKAEELGNAGNTNLFEAGKNLATIGIGALNPGLNGEAPKTTAPPTTTGLATPNSTLLGPGNNESTPDWMARQGYGNLTPEVALPQQGTPEWDQLWEQFTQLLISDPNKARELGTQLGLGN